MDGFREARYKTRKRAGLPRASLLMRGCGRGGPLPHRIPKHPAILLPGITQCRGRSLWVRVVSRCGHPFLPHSLSGSEVALRAETLLARSAYIPALRCFTQVNRMAIMSVGRENVFNFFQKFLSFIAWHQFHGTKHSEQEVSWTRNIAFRFFVPRYSLSIDLHEASQLFLREIQLLS